VDEELAENRDLGLGDTLRMHGFTPEQLASNAAGSEPPRGPAMDLVVTGVFRTPNDVVPRPSPVDVVYAGTQDLVLGPAWYERFRGQVGMFGPEGALELRLRDGLAAVDEVEAQVRRIAGENPVEIDANSESSMAQEAADRSVRFGVVSILAFAAVAGITGLALLGQALARTLALEAEDVPVLRSLGIGSSSLTAVAGLRAAAIAVPAVVVAVGVAVPLSALFPISLARRAEIDPGVDVDLPALVLGAAALAVILVFVGLVTGARLARGGAARQPARPSRVAARVAGLGAPPTIVTGVRLALERGRGRSALTGLALAVVVVVAAATFGRSLDNLADSPKLQGWNWDVVVGDAEEASIEDMGELLERNPNVAGWSPAMRPFPADVGGAEVDLEAVGRGDGPTFAAVDGRAPTRAGEIALGDDTLEELGARIGDQVDVRFDTVVEDELELRGEGRLTIVGTVLFNDANDAKTELGTGALVTLDGLEALGGEPFVSRFTVDYAEGVDEDEAYRSLQEDFFRTVLRPVPSVDVLNLRRVGGFPAILAGVVGALALAVLAHAIVTTLRRRRRDLAVMRTLGFLRLQLGAVVLAFATTTVVVAVVIGAPVGIGIGRWAWRLVADSLGSPAPPVVPVLVVVLVAPLTLLVAAAVAALPARSAAGTEPALVLRSE
jgi:predicted lysophospholipase L1 biosynthesis ABC-type transport system permease subunit